MDSRFSWRSPGGRLVLNAALDLLVEGGLEAVSVVELRIWAGAAGRALPDDLDLDEVLVAALSRIKLFTEPAATGSLRGDLRALLRHWRGALSRDEIAVAAVLSAARWRPRLRRAVECAFDRPLAQATGALVARAATRGEGLTGDLYTLNWVLRSVALDRLRSGGRSQVDIDRLVEFLVAGFEASADRPAGPPASSDSPHDLG